MDGLTERFFMAYSSRGMESFAAKRNAAHPGFKAVQTKIEKSGYSKKAAGAILANASRNASAGAKKANPRLNRVKGK